MTETEVGKLLAVALAAYPQWTSKWNEAMQRGLAKSWTRVLSDYTYQQGSAALDIYMRRDEKNLFPGAGQIATIIDGLKETVSPHSMTPAEAWAIVRPAIRDSTYHSKEHFAEFPEIVQEAVRRPEQLCEWAQLDSNTVDSVVYSNFVNRIFPAVLKRKKDHDRLPSKVQAVVDQILAENEKKIETTDKTQSIAEKHTEAPDRSDHSEQIAMLEENFKHE